MSSLLEKAGMIYDYMQEKPWVKTYMTIRPMKTLVEKHVTGLGFKCVKAKKDLEIKLDPKDKDWKCKLILAYHSMNLTPVFLLEGCIATLILSNLSKGDFLVSDSVELATIFKVLAIYQDIFASEILTKFKASPDQMMQRVQYFAERGILEVSADQMTAKLTNSDSSQILLNFFSQLVLPLIDTYLITLNTIEQLCGKNLVIKQKTLTKELHVGIKYLYSQGCLPMLHSCLRETIVTACSRFAQMGLLEITSYLTKKGNSTVFLQCPSESGPKMRALLDRLGRDRNFNKQHQEMIFNEIDQVIMRTQGPLPMPKL